MFWINFLFLPWYVWGPPSDFSSILDILLFKGRIFICFYKFISLLILCIEKSLPFTVPWFSKLLQTHSWELLWHFWILHPTSGSCQRQFLLPPFLVSLHVSCFVFEKLDILEHMLQQFQVLAISPFSESFSCLWMLLAHLIFSVTRLTVWLRLPPRSVSFDSLPRFSPLF